MNKEIIKLSILAFFAGLFCKIRVALNDNNLFNYFILDNNKEYINEFLKSAHCMLLIYVSSNYIYPLLFFVIPNIILMFKDPKAFEMPYEYSGFYACLIFLGYLIINKFSQFQQLFFNYFSIAFVVLTFVGTYVVETIVGMNKIEFGYTKLAVRAVATIAAFSALFINYYFKLVPDELAFFVWYVVGYCLTSCFFQIFLILKSPKPVDKPVDKPDDKPVDKPDDKPIDKPDDKPIDKPEKNGLEKE